MSEKKKSKFNSYQDVLDEIEKRRGYLSIDTSDVNADYIKSFMSASQKYFNDAQGIYDAINWGNASATYDERNSAWQALSERANKVGAYYYKNRNRYSNYDDIVSMLDELSSGGTGILDQFKNARNQYTQYQTEEDYKRAVAEAEAYNTTINSKDFAPLVEKGKANEKTLWEQDLQKLLTTSEYDKYTNPFEVAKDQWNNLTQGDWEEYIKTGIIGGLYSTFPQVAKPLEMFMKGLDIKDFADKWIIDGLRIDEQLSDAEKNMYYYYLGKEDYDTAQAYFDKLVEVAKSRKAENYALKYNDTFWELPMSLGAGVDSFVTGFDTAMSKLGNVVYDRESATYDPTTLQYAQGMMSSEKLVFNEETGKYETLWDANEGLWKVANDLANTIGNQLPTIALNVATGGVAGAIPMGISAAGNAYSEMKKVEGVEDWQAMAYGISIGVLEATLQKWIGGITGLGSDGGIAKLGVEKLQAALPSLSKGLAKFALTAAGNMTDEAIEEALQEILDPIVKNIITMDDGENESIDWGQVAYAGLLGALSAGALEVAPSGVNTIKNLNTTKNTYSGISSELVNDILSKNPNDAFALKMQDKLGKGKKLSGGNLAALVERGDRTAIESAITQKLTERGERGDVTKLSQALAKEAMGYGLSKAEANLIQSSDFGRSIQSELNPDNLSSNAEMDRWAEKIGTREVNPKQYNKQVEVKTIKEDGKVELESGKIVDAKSVSFANESDDLIFKIATERVSRVDGWTNETANAMVKGYDGKTSATDYRKAYISAFEMGKNGEQASQIVELANQTGIKGSTLLAAYDMGMRATEKALTNSTEGGKIESEVKTDESTGIRLRDSSKRNGSKDSQKQVSRVEESTGRDTSREDTERKVADSEAVKLADEGRKVKVSELGILNGSKTQTVTGVDKSQETSEMKRARKEAEKRGLKVIFFLGDNLVIEENGELISVRGYIKGEYVFVRADHPLYTSYQLMRHEIGHDMIAKGEVDINKVRAKLEETVGKENIDTVADMYAEAYEKSGLDADALWEECICDSLGDMNVFSKFADIDQRVVAAVLGDIKQATEDTKTAPNKTRGAPVGKTSRDLSIEGDSAVETKPLSNRELLANALLDTVQNEVEYKKLDDYKAVIKYLEAEETKLESLKEQIRSLDYSKDKAKFKELREEIRKTEARIDIHDKKLLQLESTTALKNVLERAKKEAYSKALAKGRETLHANVEGRHKTIERNRIKDIAHDLDKLLNKGTKKRNVKIGAQPIVSALLDITDRLMATDDELIMSGIVTETNSVEEDALGKYRELYNELHSTDDDVTNHKEERKALRQEMNEVKKDLVELLERERKRINKAKAKDSMTALIDEYAKLKNAKEGYLNLAYKQEVYDHLVTLRDNLKEKLVSEMSLDDLKSLHKACTMIQKMVTDSNKIFREGKTEDIKERVSPILGDVNKLSKREQDALAAFGNLAEGVESFNWKNLRPVDVFTIIGSPKLKELFWDVINAQDKYGANVNKITKDIVEFRKKYGYQKWDTNKAMTIKTVDGDFKVTLGELMSIYAYSKREQADLHMSEGGFQHLDKSYYKDDKGLYRKRAKAEHPYRIGQLQRPEIISMLTKEQRDYVDALVDYITKYGEKGNEVSRTLYDIDLFTETHYFPLKSSHDFLASTQTQIGQTQTTSSLSNIGMSKPTTPNANNPIILQSFDDVILEHLDSMSKYNAYVIPIENLRKVLDFVDRDSNKSLKTIIGSRLGTGASNYLEQYITDLNGGKSAESGTLAKMFGRGKAASVMMNLSVWIQQYFSIIRAMSKVNPKYFIPFLGEKFKNPSMKLYEEMKTYAPITTIKEMGGFDVGSNRALKEYVGFEETKFNKNVLAKKANDIFGIGATLMDKAGWMTIWSAIKKEVAHEQGFKEGSKEYFEACRKRMNEVVTETQVYDSVNARSGMMRSKSELDKFATSFMGEPTVIVGMAETSVVKLKRAIASKDADAIKEALGDFAGVATSIVLSTAMTSLAKSLIYAIRDDDEDETFEEKYATAIGSAIVNDINPMNYVPYARDISSIIEGWTVDRPDMQLIEDFVNASKKLLVYNEGDNLAEEGLGAALSFANIFGLPLKNALRDIKAMVNLVDTLSRNYKSSTEGLLLKGVASGSWVLQTLLDDKGTLSKSEKLYRAMVDGDVSRLDYFKSTYEDEKSYESAVRKSLRDNDPRVEQAALARLNRDNDTYYNLMMDIIDEGIFDRKMVKEAFEAEYNYQKRLKEEAEK